MSPFHRLTLLALSASALAGLAAAGKEEPATSLPPLQRLDPQATIGQTLGINEALAIPDAVRARVKTDTKALERILDEAAGLARDRGASMVRANTSTYPFLSLEGLQRVRFAWDEADRFFRATGRAGLDTAVVIGPWPARDAATATTTYLPADLELYESYVRSLVERYNGDGLQDMPGLVRGVSAWEIDSEPDRNNAHTPDGLARKHDPRKFATPAEYATLVAHTVKAVRAVDKQATLVLGSIHAPTSKQGRRYLEALLAEPGVVTSVDAVGFHLQAEEDLAATLAGTLAVARELPPGKPVWITELGLPSRRFGTQDDPDWQGRVLAPVVVDLLLAGVDRIFWQRLFDAGSDDSGSPYPTCGLLERRGSEALDKPAGRVFASLAHHLGSLRADQLVDVEAEGGRLLRAGKGWLALTGEPKLPYEAVCVEDMLTGKVSMARETAKAPAWVMRVDACKQVPGVGG